MKRILVLPLFKMESGHHRSANALVEAFQKHDPEITCEKVDFLSYVHSGLEKFVSNAYLTWIRKFPKAYSSFYHLFFSKKSDMIQSAYEAVFLEKMEQLIEVKQPDLIVCTHSFPSFLVDKLKRYGVCHVPVLNLYTDFFINGLWGMEQVDLHCVPSQDVKSELLSKGIAENKVIVSGILADDRFSKRRMDRRSDDKIHVLLSGGSLGLGENLSSLLNTSASGLVEYKVLCGSNRRLFEKVKNLHSPHVTALPYISSAEQMNHLYSWADAIVTKPGGATISEAIRKKLLIFIHSVLPGQEEVNLDYLLNRGLAQTIVPHRPFEDELLSILSDSSRLFAINKARHLYMNELETRSCIELVTLIEKKLFTGKTSVKDQYLNELFTKLYKSL
ncbi:galactosyldiacylglycerol synthase [Bacillus sp. FJAT-42376]|uniref:MGDG synthase family glycosyltransferase n=1 Tax=Bacillus sp. FJAT-42376 TaxID=2014076 RepID=UPI000F4F9DCD|nr:galactosyldiacylglycerol synthase [Bacillus sp. FJAT-42376]AZB44364.1 galactosyldiacylglycerol synthase [Bacillus sp. FJAT-42376]